MDKERNYINIFLLLLSFFLFFPFSLRGEGLPGSKGKSLKGGQWGRNPFFTPQEAEIAKKGIEPETKEKEKEEALNLSTIMISNSKKVAVINHNILSVGETIGGEKVVDITPYGVFLESGGKRRLIILRQSEIPLVEKGNKRRGIN